MGVFFSEKQEGVRVKKITYCFYSLFFGALGIHKFYAGQNEIGMWYALFCWTGIPSCLGVLEFIDAFTTSADPEGYIVR